MDDSGAPARRAAPVHVGRARHRERLARPGAAHAARARRADACAGLRACLRLRAGLRRAAGDGADRAAAARAGGVTCAGRAAAAFAAAAGRGLRGRGAPPAARCSARCTANSSARQPGRSDALQAHLVLLATWFLRQAAGAAGRRFAHGAARHAGAALPLAARAASAQASAAWLLRRRLGCHTRPPEPRLPRGDRACRRWTCSTSGCCSNRGGCWPTPRARWPMSRTNSASTIRRTSAASSRGVPGCRRRPSVPHWRAARRSRLEAAPTGMGRQAGTISTGLIFFSTAFALRCATHRSHAACIASQTLARPPRSTPSQRSSTQRHLGRDGRLAVEYARQRPGSRRVVRRRRSRSAPAPGARRRERVSPGRAGCA